MKTIIILAVCLIAFGPQRLFSADDSLPKPNPNYQADWRWVHGAVFVPTSVVNEAQQWDQYDSVINDRELHYASIYGINCVRVYLHYFIYLKDKERLLKNIEDFLSRADKYGIKVELVFFDDCWNEPEKEILKADYKYPNPIFGVHNSRWLLSPGHEILKRYEEHRDRLKAYVQDIVSAHKADPRIAFWETYNEPKTKTPGILKLIKDAQIWVHETGTKIPVTATGSSAIYCGDPYSDFLTWHHYSHDYKFLADPVHALNTESMCRKEQSIPDLVEHWKGKTGFMVWEFGIGRDDCRFYWGETADKPAADEHEKPFHGLVFADGHPWSTNDIAAWLGAEAYAKLPVYHVTYFRDTAFTSAVKASITPSIDFDLKDEIGYGSPDTSIHLAKDFYSIRWTGEIVSPATGSATFFVKSDGAMKVSLDGNTIIVTSAKPSSSRGDLSTEHPKPLKIYGCSFPPKGATLLLQKSLIDKMKGSATEASGTVALAAGKPAKIIVEYVHETGPASVHLDWVSPNGKRQVLFPSSHP